MRVPRSRAHLAAIAFVLAAVLAGCGDDGGGSPDDAAPRSEPAGAGAEANGDVQPGDEQPGGGESGGEPDQPVPTGEARATIEMRGEVHELALDETVVQVGSVRCNIYPETQDASVGGMVSADGLQFDMLNAVGHWAAVVIEPGGTTWRAGAADPSPDTDYTIEVTEGRLVIDGTWGDNNDRLEEIRVELICPPTEDGTDG